MLGPYLGPTVDPYTGSVVFEVPAIELPPLGPIHNQHYKSPKFWPLAEMQRRNFFTGQPRLPSGPVQPAPTVQQPGFPPPFMLEMGGAAGPTPLLPTGQPRDVPNAPAAFPGMPPPFMSEMGGAGGPTPLLPTGAPARTVPTAQQPGPQMGTATAGGPRVNAFEHFLGRAGEMLAAPFAAIAGAAEEATAPPEDPNLDPYQNSAWQWFANPLTQAGFAMLMQGMSTPLKPYRGMQPLQAFGAGTNMQSALGRQGDQRNADRSFYRMFLERRGVEIPEDRRDDLNWLRNAAIQQQSPRRRERR